MAKITNASEWIDWWNECAADKPVFGECSRGSGRYYRCYQTDGVVDYYVSDTIPYFCPYCYSKYDSKSKKFPEITDVEKAWLLLSFK